MRISPSSDNSFSSPRRRPSLNSTPASARAFFMGSPADAGGGRYGSQHPEADRAVVLVGLSHLVPDIGGKLCQYQGMGSIV